VSKWIERFYNAIRGYGFYWVRTNDGSSAGGYIEVKEGTCPHPVQFDWSAKACIKAGLCGCHERVKNGMGGIAGEI
jgi:hypothetical protein